MINSKDTETIKELVVSALLQATENTGGGDRFLKYIEIRPIVERAFDIVIREMKVGKI